ncbi:MAG: imidazole glycerol phosphate synthase subunit HisH [Rhizobiaceae bacterium]|nr:imidazole glycerol phosphate synthase subunit HisH [Rhizobiaceae bacterium]
MKTVIIDYGSGNLHSAAKAFERARRDSALDGEIIVTDKPDIVAECDRVVLPGVGAFADCHAGLEAVDGMEEALQDAVVNQAKPFFGICVGMQLMATRGLEKITTPGFDWISGDVVEIRPQDKHLKIPQIGWNTLDIVNNHQMLEGIKTGPNGLHAYFVHSFHLEASNNNEVVARCDYGGPVSAIVARDNMFGTQFHPEKSQKLGLALIANFLRWNP